MINQHSKKIRTFTIMVLTLLLVLLPFSQISYSQKSPVTYTDEHVIQDVPYFPQTEGYFCYYSCIAMILDFYGLNTSLNEILFLDGLGYSHYYQEIERLPEEGRYSDISHVFQLFGVEQQRWTLEHDQNSDDNWNHYLMRVTENISNNRPVITSANPFSLPSLRSQFKISDKLWNALFLPGFHIILLIGYNLTNNTICYQDPNAGFYGENQYGEYAWMPLDEFRKCTEQVVWGNYYVSTLIETSPGLPPQQRFEQTILLNKQKLNGTYAPYNFSHGIEVTTQLIDDYSPGINNSTDTIKNYKKDGTKGFIYSFRELLQKILDIIRPGKPNLMSIFMIGEDNPFEEIAKEKIHVSHYLQNSTFYQNLCINQSSLLNQEADIWLHLGQLYKNFLRKGYFISTNKATEIIQAMKISTESILHIEKRIVNEK